MPRNKLIKPDDWTVVLRLAPYEVWENPVTLEQYLVSVLNEPDTEAYEASVLAVWDTTRNTHPPVLIPRSFLESVVRQVGQAAHRQENRPFEPPVDPRTARIRLTTNQWDPHTNAINTPTFLQGLNEAFLQPEPTPEG